jgi:hypothetical protein
VIEEDSPNMRCALGYDGLLPCAVEGLVERLADVQDLFDVAKDQTQLLLVEYLDLLLVVGHVALNGRQEDLRHEHTCVMIPKFVRRGLLNQVVITYSHEDLEVVNVLLLGEDELLDSQIASVHLLLLRRHVLHVQHRHTGCSPYTSHARNSL